MKLRKVLAGIAVAFPFMIAIGGFISACGWGVTLKGLAILFLVVFVMAAFCWGIAELHN